jgi:hypothetical protein
MKRATWVVLAASAIVAGPVAAETITVGDEVAVRESTVERPGRGQSMQAVESRFGQPVNRHAAVGEPPITRWDYADFSVFFEHNLVIHAVAKRS